MSNPLSMPVEPGETSGLMEALASAEFEVLEGGAVPMFNAESVAAALLDRRGRVVFASAAFAAMQSEHPLEETLLARLAEASRSGVEIVALDDAAAGSAVFAYARAAQAVSWRLPPEVASAAAEHPDHVVILTSQVVRAGPLEAACRAYGLSGLQTRVALETIRTGAVKTAARLLGVSYHTAREALAEAMKRVRAPRLPALVQRLSSLAFGVLPQDDGGEILGDLWGLSSRQAAIAGLVADGMSRAGVAAALGLSEAVVKKEIDQVHLVLQVSTGAALARRVVEANALRWLTRATGGDIGFVETGAEPLQFVHRPDGGRIAVSDYGPVSGKPILVVHSSMTTRILPRGLLRALQGKGYRPISIDRPGFGLTDEVPGLRAGAHDPYATAAQDAIAVLDRLKVRAPDLIARGGAQFVLALEKAAPGRLRRVVLINPTPHTTKTDRNVGALGVLKEAFRRNPAMIRLAAAVFVRQTSFERTAEFMRRFVRGSPPDEIAVRDPELLRDHFRSTRTFATGRYGGYVNEQTEFAQGTQPPPLPGTADWRVLISAHDVIHDPRHALAYWRRVLPDARFEIVPDTGRLLGVSHPELVVAALVA